MADSKKVTIQLNKPILEALEGYITVLSHNAFGLTLELTNIPPTGPLGSVLREEARKQGVEIY